MNRGIDKLTEATHSNKGELEVRILISGGRYTCYDN